MKNRMGNIVLTLFSVAGLVFSASACKQIMTTAASVPPQMSGGFTTVDWIYGFDNLTDLYVYADAVFIGTVDREAAASGASQPGYLETGWVFRVEKMLKGPDSREITVEQAGAPEYPGYDSSDDPLYAPGDRYLLFVLEGAPGVYSTSGPRGRYLIWNNLVYSMNHILLTGQYQAPAEMDFNGVTLDATVSKINRTMDAPQISLTMDEDRYPAEVIRHASGNAIEVHCVISTGKAEKGSVVLQINSNVPEDKLWCSINPGVLATEPEHEYQSTILIQTSAELPEGEYQIPVKCVFADGSTVTRTITLYIDNS